ncbi:MAG: tetratricopeptide repeat protein [Opitutaceae bacterium]|nr:tetratricopeptide repeat protein [Opitutaceae bacterium]MBP9912872.1 tetratricopeptide repeat protein [Opitutaceae bacterium]
MAGLGVVRAAGLAPVWEHVADSRGTEAQVAFSHAKENNPRERAATEVVLTLMRPPVAEGKLTELEATLAGLAQGEDETAALALYLSGRVQQIHHLHADYPRAAEFYREAARRFPQSHWAQLGLVKLGLLTLYVLPEPVDPAARIAAATAQLAGITEPALRRDLQLQIGQAALGAGRPLDEVLPHLMAAEAVGGLLGIVAEDLVIQIGELSLRAGHTAQGRSYLEKFLREYPTNTRRYTIEQRLAEVALDAAPAREVKP